MRKAWCDICGKEMKPEDTEIARVQLDTSYNYDIHCDPVHLHLEVCDCCIGSVRRQIGDLKRYFGTENKEATA